MCFIFKALILLLHAVPEGTQDAIALEKIPLKNNLLHVHRKRESESKQVKVTSFTSGGLWMLRDTEIYDILPWAGGRTVRREKKFWL